MPLEIPLQDCMSVLAFLQDRKPALMLNLLLIPELAREVLLPIISTPFSDGPFPGCPDPFIFIKGPVPQLLLLYPFFSNAALRDVRNYKLSAISACPFPPRGLSNCTFMHSTKTPIEALIGGRPHASHLNMNNRHLILSMVAEKKRFELMETAISKVQEGKERPLHSSQSLDRKLLQAVNRELAGWELDYQAEVSECLTS